MCLPHGWQGSKQLDHAPLFSPGHQQGNGTEVKQPGHRLVSILNANVTVSGFTYYATMAALHTLILKGALKTQTKRLKIT